MQGCNKIDTFFTSGLKHLLWLLCLVHQSPGASAHGSHGRVTRNIRLMTPSNMFQSSRILYKLAWCPVFK